MHGVQGAVVGPVGPGDTAILPDGSKSGGHLNIPHILYRAFRRIAHQEHKGPVNTTFKEAYDSHRPMSPCVFPMSYSTNCVRAILPDSHDSVPVLLW